MKLGRLTFNTHHMLRSTLSLSMVTIIALYAGGSVPNEFRRYIVTQQDTSAAAIFEAVESNVSESWKSVGGYVVDNNLLTGMTGRERTAIKATYQKEITQANTEATIRNSIRIPLLPGPIATPQAGPTERSAPASASAQTALATRQKAGPTHKAPAQPPVSPKQSATAEDLATIEALKAALQDLKKEGVMAGTYRDDIADN